MANEFDPQRYWENRWAANKSHDPASLKNLYNTVRQGPPFPSKNHTIRSGHLEWLQKALAQWRGKKLLDAGCGPGFWFPLWAELEMDTKAVDRTEIGVADAKAQNEVLGENIKVSHAELSNLPFADNSFDVAVTVMVLLHTPPREIRNTMNELGRVAKNLILCEHIYPDNATLSPHVFNHDYLALASDLNYGIGAEWTRKMDFGYESLLVMTTRE